MEIECRGILLGVDHVNLVCYSLGDILGNRHKQGIVCDVTGVEHSLLVVEEHLCNAAQVLTYQAEG